MFSSAVHSAADVRQAMGTTPLDAFVIQSGLMSIDAPIDLAVVYDFRELFLANLRFSIQRVKYILALALIALLLNVFAFARTSFGTMDERWETFGDNLMPLGFVAFVILLLVPVGCAIRTRKTLRDPRFKSGFQVSHH